MRNQQPVPAIGLPIAERLLVEHLAALGGQSRRAHRMNRGTIQDFLTYCRGLQEQPADRLLIDRAELLRWLIQICVGKAPASTSQQLSILARYSRALTRAGLFETDLMAEFKANHGHRGWERLAIALRSSDPEAELAALRAAAIRPAPGPLSATIGPFIVLRQALGLKCVAERNTLLDLDRFVRTLDIASPRAITAAHIEQWLKPMDVTAVVRASKARYVSRFFDHLRSIRLVSANPVHPSLLVVGKRRRAFKPFIFTKEQIAGILDAAKRLPDNKRFPCRAQTCSTMLMLLCALGLRHGEVRRLRFRDVDLGRQTLFIDRTKFHKSRYVPFGPRVGRCLEQFLKVRRMALSPSGGDDLLFMTPSRVRLAYESLGNAFNDILLDLRRSGVTDQQPPRVHDLRHTFAVHRLVRWYREGVDVQSRLPLLSVFLGHVDVCSTQVYLTMTGDLLQEANNRFHSHIASTLVGEVRR